MKARTVTPTIQEARDTHPTGITRLKKPAAIVGTMIVTASLIEARTSPIPYLWVAIASVIVLSYAAMACVRPGLRALWMNLAVVIFALGAAETYFWLLEPYERRMEYTENFFIADEILGYKPAPGKSFTHRTSVRDGLLYHVTYTINAEGLRIASPVETPAAINQPCLAFFGDSFTFGEGVNDEQTMPYQVWKNVAGRYHTVNFGFLGYGPHQMLAALEQGYLESQGHCRPAQVIYQTIPEHLPRSAGLEFWDPHGPRYVLDQSGQVRHTGHFDEVPATGILDRLRTTHRQLSTGWKDRLNRSALYRTLLRTRRAVNEQDAALYGGIVAAAKQLVETRYPGARFHVLLWDFDDSKQEAEWIQQTLAQHHVPVTTMSQILRDFPRDRGRYEIHPNDRHPNALAHAQIADFVAQHLVNSSADEAPR